MNFYGYVGNSPVNWTDPSGLFSPNVHFDVTRNAALKERVDPITAGKLALATAWVDFRPNSQRAENAFWHAMSSTALTPEEAADAMEQYVRAAMETGDLAAALHALQDGFARGHAGFQIYLGRLRDLPRHHILGDWCPSSQEWNSAEGASRALIRQFYEMRAFTGPSVQEWGDIWRDLED